MGVFWLHHKAFGIVTKPALQGLAWQPPGAPGQRRYHPAIPPAMGMAVELTVADCTQRLADQLRTLSEVAETLTFRLLELEERLAAQELKVQPLLETQSAGQGLIAEDTELRLGDTEDRLARLEGLLSGLESPGAARHLQPVEMAPQESFLDDGLPEDSFLDEEEQPFLDELSA
jgi:hypothetical protein